MRVVNFFFQNESKDNYSILEIIFGLAISKVNIMLWYGVQLHYIEI